MKKVSPVNSDTHGLAATHTCEITPCTQTIPMNFSFGRRSKIACRQSTFSAKNAVAGTLEHQATMPLPAG